MQFTRIFFIIIQVLYEFVFAKTASIAGPFGIFSVFPRKLIDAGDTPMIDGTEGVLVVEEGEDLWDPLSSGIQVCYLVR